MRKATCFSCIPLIITKITGIQGLHIYRDYDINDDYIIYTLQQFEKLLDLSETKDRRPGVISRNFNKGESTCNVTK